MPRWVLAMWFLSEVWTMLIHFTLLSLSFSVHFLCPLSLSLSVCLRVLLCVLCVLWCVWCVVVCVCCVLVCVELCVARLGTQKKTSVCRFKTFPCVPAPPAHVLPHAGVVPVHTGTFWNLHTEVFLDGHTEEGPSVLLTEICTQDCHVFQRGSPKETFWSYPFKVWEQVENNTFPSPSNHSL